VISALPNLHIEPTTVPSVTAATKPLQDSTWAILLHGKLTRASRRWSMAHELKHILDHPFETILYARPQGSRDLAQDTCEYFAACLLMPARWVRLAWRTGMHDPRALARHFGVPPYAAVVRLLQLGLIPPTSRHLTREA
jgi:Zn-dependent peptidase ImmA (M78 family)